MAEKKSVNVDVDMNRVVDVLAASFSQKLADAEKENAMLRVALENAIQEHDAALEDNTRLRASAVPSPD